MNFPRSILWAAALALLLGLIPLCGQLSNPVDLEVRTIPWRTQAGRMQRSTPLGQGFTCTFNGLKRIDVGLVPLTSPEGAQLELILREGTPAGKILRRTLATELPDESGWGRFDFEELTDSAGRQYWWQLKILGDKQQSPYSPWIRYHGQLGIDMAWGHRIARGQVFEGRLRANRGVGNAAGFYPRVPHPNLSAVSFAAETLRPAIGPVVLELWGPGQVPFESEPLRRVELTPEQATHGGYAFFAFEPIADSRWMEIYFRLTVNKGVRLVGAEEGLSFLTWHGKGQPAANLLGYSSGSRVLKDRSLIFRAFSSPSAMELVGRMAHRGGWRLGLGALLWLCAVACLARTLGKA